MRELEVTITSYNRGPFLRHCVATVERCVPYARITIRDDDSDDPETCAVLDELATRHRVLRGRAAHESKHGGLYSHMQAALDACPDDCLLLFLQDDVQLVRALSQDELESLYGLFQRRPRLGFISPTFLPTPGRRGGYGDFNFDAKERVYEPVPRGRGAGCHYSDICLCLPGRLRAVNWQFGPREPHCERRAREHFTPMAIPLLPFAAWLPLVPAFRGRGKTWALAYAERLRGAGFHPFAQLDSARCAALQARDPAQLPIAEELLALRETRAPRPWHHKPLQGHRFLQRLDSLETRWRRAVQALRAALRRADRGTGS